MESIVKVISSLVSGLTFSRDGHSMREIPYEFNNTFELLANKADGVANGELIKSLTVCEDIF